MNNLVDRYQVYSYAAQAYSTPLGATVLNTDAVANQNLQDLWVSDPFGSAFGEHFWHSAEFNGDYWLQVPFWQRLLRTGFNAPTAQ